jgi:hypothetical protein
VCNQGVKALPNQRSVLAGVCHEVELLVVEVEVEVTVVHFCMLRQGCNHGFHLDTYVR